MRLFFMLDVALPFDNLVTHIKRSLWTLSANTECSANQNAVKAFKMMCEKTMYTNKIYLLK